MEPSNRPALICSTDIPWIPKATFISGDSFEGVDNQISSVKDYINEIKNNSDLDLDVKTDKLDA